MSRGPQPATLDGATDRAIARALNAEAQRTNGEHPSSHVLVIDGIGYYVPRRQWGVTHSASGRPFGIPRAKVDTLHLRRVGRCDRCTCVMCRST